MIAERAEFLAGDGTRLSAAWDAPDAAGDSGVLLLPGYWRRAESPRIRELALDLARRFPVLTLDFRGHGRSGGTFTFGRLEHLDVEAALGELARRGVRRAVIVGMSMGGAATLVTLGRQSAPAATTVARPVAALVIAAPSAFGRIRPSPWRGRRVVAWEDAWRIPRTGLLAAFGPKLEPCEHAARVTDLPIRIVHGREDWLVHHSHGQALHEACGACSELLLVEERGAHADELLARAPQLMARLVRPWVAAALIPASASDPAAASGGEGREIDPAPWAEALGELLADERRHSADLGGMPPRGPISRLRAFASPDGAHLAFLAGGEACWARGLRDGSCHGLNLLSTQLVTDGAAWSPALRGALLAALGDLVPGAGRRWRVIRRGAGGLEARPEPGGP